MSIKPEFHLTYSQKIWNIYTGGAKYILLELRDEGKMGADFDLYNVETRNYQWRGRFVSENWRTGVSYCTDEYIVFHEYKSGTIPAIESLICLDAHSGDEKWRKDNFQPLSFGKAYIKGNLGNQTLFLSLASGEVKGEVENFQEEYEINPLILPLKYSESSKNFETVKQFVKMFLYEDAIGSAEYYEYGQHIFVAYHIREGDKLLVKLAGIKTSGLIWLTEIIGEGDKPLSDNFFIWNKYLLYFIGKNELKAIKLTEK